MLHKSADTRIKRTVPKLPVRRYFEYLVVYIEYLFRIVNKDQLLAQTAVSSSRSIVTATPVTAAAGSATAATAAALI